LVFQLLLQTSPTASANPVQISNPLINWLEAPVTGAVPLNEHFTSEYRANLIWAGNPVNFEANSSYELLIVLEPYSGYTYDGLPSDYFTIDSATSYSFDVDTGVITVQFPGTEPVGGLPPVIESIYLDSPYDGVIPVRLSEVDDLRATHNSESTQFGTVVDRMDGDRPLTTFDIFDYSGEGACEEVTEVMNAMDCLAESAGNVINVHFQAIDNDGNTTTITLSYLSIEDNPQIAFLDPEDEGNQGAVIHEGAIDPELNIMMLNPYWVEEVSFDYAVTPYDPNTADLVVNTGTTGLTVMLIEFGSETGFRILFGGTAASGSIEITATGSMVYPDIPALNPRASSNTITLVLLPPIENETPPTPPVVVYIPPTPIPYLTTLTTPKLNLIADKLVCTPGTYNAGYTLDGVIQGSSTTLFSPTSVTYNLLINGVIENSLTVTSSNSSNTWNLPAATSGTIFTCAVTVNLNTITNTDRSNSNSALVSTVLSTQVTTIATANSDYSASLNANSKTYQMTLADNRTAWRSSVANNRATYLSELSRINASSPSKETRAQKSAALKNYMTAQKQIVVDYKASQPAALTAKQTADKAALDTRNAAIAKANATYGTFIESIGYGVLVP
jgi:hypothetical protein